MPLRSSETCRFLTMSAKLAAHASAVIPGPTALANDAVPRIHDDERIGANCLSYGPSRLRPPDPFRQI